MNQSEKILEIKDLCVEFQTVEGTVKAINHLNYTLPVSYTHLDVYKRQGYACAWHR